MQEAERKQQELREKMGVQGQQRVKMADAQISNARGMHDADSIFAPLNDYVEKRGPLKRLFFSVYDNLGVLMAINLFTFVLTVPLIAVIWVLWAALLKHQSAAAFSPLLLLGVLIAAPGWGAASRHCARIAEEEMHALSDYWSDLRALAGRSIILAIGQWVVAFVLVYATGWYLGQRGAVAFIGIISLYLVLFWALAGLYVWPLMVRGYRWRAVVRNAVVLVFGAPIRSISILLLLCLLTIVLTFTGIGLVILAFSLWAMLPNQSLVLTRERLEQRTRARL